MVDYLILIHCRTSVVEIEYDGLAVYKRLGRTVRASGRVSIGEAISMGYIIAGIERDGLRRIEGDYIACHIAGLRCRRTARIGGVVQINLILKHCGAGIVKIEHDRLSVYKCSRYAVCAGMQVCIGKAVGIGQVVVRVERNRVLCC
ncbi:hypothetical protein SDC9_111885 [bioreactor metagenome]|uniref:Uncharacterized protein n=1 Tax=bioreactor metagenome TaxID=1076179 RepID=A0A645BP41_9ZZZZ